MVAICYESSQFVCLCLVSEKYLILRMYESSEAFTITLSVKDEQDFQSTRDERIRIMVRIEFKACTRCGGDYVHNNYTTIDGEVYCIQCSYRPPEINIEAFSKNDREPVEQQLGSTVNGI